MNKPWPRTSPIAALAPFRWAGGLQRGADGGDVAAEVALLDLVQYRHADAACSGEEAKVLK
jgi:hypothetical protein